MQATKICVISHLMRKMIDLDRFDRRLLDQVRVDNLQPARVLADKVGLSISAVLRRLRRLRADGVIVADRDVINPALTGSALIMHVLVRMEQEGAQTMDRSEGQTAEIPALMRTSYDHVVVKKTPKHKSTH